MTNRVKACRGTSRAVGLVQKIAIARTGTSTILYLSISLSLSNIYIKWYIIDLLPIPTQHPLNKSFLFNCEKHVIPEWTELFRVGVTLQGYPQAVEFALCFQMGFRSASQYFVMLSSQLSLVCLWSGSSRHLPLQAAACRLTHGDKSRACAHHCIHKVRLAHKCAHMYTHTHIRANGGHLRTCSTHTHAQTPRALPHLQPG